MIFHLQGGSPMNYNVCGPKLEDMGLFGYIWFEGRVCWKSLL